MTVTTKPAERFSSRFSPNFGINFDAKYMWVRANATTTFTEGTIANVGNAERIGLNPFVVWAALLCCRHFMR
jgi:hypothetical protein